MSAELPECGPGVDTLVSCFEKDAAELLPGLLQLAAARAPSSLDREALNPIRRAIGRLGRVYARTLLEGLEAMLTAPHSTRALCWLEASGALAALLPEVAALRGFHLSSPTPHKDLWDHTLLVVDKVEAHPDLRWIALCHDIGKVATRALDEHGAIAFHHHEVLGAHQFRGLGARLAMAQDRIDRIAFVIEHHARSNQYEPSWTDRAVMRLIRECGEHLPLMLAFSRADWTTKKRQKQLAIAAQQDELEARIAALQAPRPPLPDHLSEALMARCDKPPGPWLGQARRWVEDELAAGSDPADAETWARRWDEHVGSEARGQNE